jgi:hypothetical protein
VLPVTPELQVSWPPTLRLGRGQDDTAGGANGDGGGGGAGSLTTVAYARRSTPNIIFPTRFEIDEGAQMTFRANRD